MLVGSKNYRTIEASEDRSYVKIIDQTCLPFKFKIIHLKTLDEVVRAIKNMQVRGAPLIGVTAAYGFALSMNCDSSDNSLTKCKHDLVNARPTAVNLSWAVNQVYDALIKCPSKERAELGWELATSFANQDVEKNISIGLHGFNLFKPSNKKTINILTHCNAGWLATVDHGTALSPIFKLFDEGFDVHVWVDETRPRNQGLSLTAWELNQYKI
ncbi:MAG: S-methyl-5-thioribose-1-phosphate isomerase, partial [Nitrosomonadales bacterium]|nr:S-methyl-5-thioribose-1-phosphate isomerase [Nitrosomonadales bacterium]